jgi:hypothetical protein
VYSLDNDNEEVDPPGAMLSIGQCQSTRTDGRPCSAPSGDDGYCFWHDPSRREEMMEASRKGGSRKALPLPDCLPIGPEMARGILASVVAAVLEGALDPATARTVAYILQVERRIAEGSELERKMADLEELIRGSSGRTPW